MIDALDECKHGNYFVQLPTKGIRDWPLRVFFTSRPSLETQKLLSDSIPPSYVQEVSLECTAADIRRYVENQTDFPSMQDPVS